MLNKNLIFGQTAQISALQKTILGKLIIICLELIFALPVGLAFARFRIGGVAWIFGGIVAGGLVLTAYSILSKETPQPNQKIRKIGQALVGLVIGFTIAHANTAELYSKLPIFVFVVLFLMTSGSAIGYIYSRISNTNILTAMLATTPGGIGIMSSIAADYEKNAAQVALVQIIRVTTVVFLIPVLARIFTDNSINTAVSVPNLAFSFEPLHLSLLASSLALTFLSVRINSILKVPAPFFFGALIVGVTFNYAIGLFPLLANVDFTPPFLIRLIGQIFLGISIGEYWGSKPNLNKKTIAYALIPVIMTICVGFIAAGITKFLTPWDWLTCMLVTAPGGSAEMILVSLALGHHVEIVTAGHLVRLIVIHVSLPLWLLLFRYFDRLLPNSGDN
ncbi:AbrB family transcriptional regulator [Aerosakkonema funiforme]|uniref:AbrB family transcriptional regulator n=1 Tax=Aerosakkonema funiforme FACHB-1375 TaxID=2949571 RepID=A0A926VL25_9CYAN|nr:AbrB family transcriptional regulator [Aerosakkonema funiforme]MBD2185238.1 AbrB family transcriptional regulator [Aerosakkonema funiforme FACHB-1375]